HGWPAGFRAEWPRRARRPGRADSPRALRLHRGPGPGGVPGRGRERDRHEAGDGRLPPGAPGRRRPPRGAVRQGVRADRPGRRPAKLYARSRQRIAVSRPPRRYEIAGEVLASALEAAREATGASEAVARAADQAGKQIAAGGTDLAEVLTRSGYEPKEGPEG